MSPHFLFAQDCDKNIITLKEASEWASIYLKRKITASNISYLIQYGHVKNYGDNGSPLINKDELKKYYDSIKEKEKNLKKILGEDVNWNLSFIEYSESERTKHVHRLHPYKGKFIPQLVEYFLDSHTDNFKKEIFFKKGDIILDPFCGSGTTLVQANECGIHAIGIDISKFNVLISNAKIGKYNFKKLLETINNLTIELYNFQKNRNTLQFEKELNIELNKFNNIYFPSPGFKMKIREKIINENEYGKEKENMFLPIYYSLIKKYKIKINQNGNKTFLDKWFLASVREEIDFIANKIKKINDLEIKKILMIILSRTVRSCRATTHSDLATLKDPIRTPYYCKKHKKICKPIFSIMKWWNRYSIDTFNRLLEFSKLKTNTLQLCIEGDSRNIDLINEVKKYNLKLADLIIKQKIAGIFSSPPYVGLINYHEQHAYAYEIFEFERKDELEIGPLFKGQGKEARIAYIKGISKVLLNCKKYLKKDYNIFLVANDKFNLYPDIAKLAGMKIVNTFKRPVLNRVEKDRSIYSETIFHLKEK